MARPVAMLLPFPAFCLRFLLAPKRHHAPAIPQSLSLQCPTRHLAASVTPLSLSERGLCGFPSGVVVVGSGSSGFPCFPWTIFTCFAVGCFCFSQLWRFFPPSPLSPVLQAPTPPSPPSAIVIKCHWLTSLSLSPLTSRPAFVAAVGAVNQLKWVSAW